MSRIRLFSGLALGLVVLLAIGFSSTKSKNDDSKKKKDKIEWTRFDEGIQTAKKEKKLLLVDFYTDWCHWCKVMDEKTYGDKTVIDYVKKNVVMAKLNAETREKFKFRDAYYSGRELSMMFGVRGFPTTVFIDSSGGLITSVSGFIPADKFKHILVYLAENWYEKMKFDEFLKKQEAKDES